MDTTLYAIGDDMHFLPFIKDRKFAIKTAYEADINSLEAFYNIYSDKGSLFNFDNIIKKNTGDVYLILSNKTRSLIDLRSNQEPKYCKGYSIYKIK